MVWGRPGISTRLRLCTSIRLPPWVTYNSPVRVVDTSGIKPVAIDGNGVYHYADAIIVTVSLGVLKAGIIDFVPDLPASKLDAIDTIGMGNGMKLSLRFSSQVWDAKMFNVETGGTHRELLDSEQIPVGRD